MPHRIGLDAIDDLRRERALEGQREKQANEAGARDTPLDELANLGAKLIDAHEQSKRESNPDQGGVLHVAALLALMRDPHAWQRPAGKSRPVMMASVDMPTALASRIATMAEGCP